MISRRKGASFHRVYRPGKHYHRPYGMQAKFERCDDAEIATATFERPEQMRVGTLADAQQTTIGSHDVRRHKVVTPHAERSTEPTLASSQCQARYTGRRNDSSDGNETEGLRLAVDLAPCGTPSARTSRLSTSTRTPRMGDRSITMPPSQVAKPAMLCAPPRTATIRPWSRAKRTARRTSATPPQRTISAGRLSIILLKTRRAAS
jgi:hypothetical protein